LFPASPKAKPQGTNPLLNHLARANSFMPTKRKTVDGAGVVYQLTIEASRDLIAYIYEAKVMHVYFTLSSSFNTFDG
jgi:hypothetical protein